MTLDTCSGFGQMRLASGSTISSLPNRRVAAAAKANPAVFHHDCGRLNPAYFHPPFRHRSEIQPRTNKLGTSFGRICKMVCPRTTKTPKAHSSRENQCARSVGVDDDEFKGDDMASQA